MRMLLPALMMLSACGLADRNVPLVYPVRKPAPALAPKVAVVKFTDNRHDPKRLGDVINPLGTKVGHLWAEHPANEWMTDGLITELRAAGVDAARTEEPNGPSITGQVLTAYCVKAMEYKVALKLKIRLASADRVLLEREYETSGTGGEMWAGTGTEAATSMNAAFGSLLRKIVPDVVAALR